MTEDDDLGTDDVLGLDAAEKIRRRARPETYEEFIAHLYKVLDVIIRMLEDSADDQKPDEELLTVQIVHNLKWTFQASHDTKTKGHVDILVQKGDFRWLGEAKVHSSYSWLFKGMCQLMTRYSTGRKNQTHSGMIIYFFRKGVKKKMHTWKQQLGKRTEKEPFKTGIGLQSITCEIEENHQFVSHHIHEVSEFEIKVRHFPVMLYTKPLDPLVK
jgi:hypothetical protein